MSTIIGHPKRVALSRHRAGLVSAAVLAAGFALTGCGTLKAIHKAVDNAKATSALVDSFTANMKKSANVSYEVTYETTGSQPSTVEYAVAPPNKYNLAITQSGGSPEDIVGDAGGLYACNETGTKWSCLTLGKAEASTYQDMAKIYTGQYWVDFLKPYAVVAGLAGDSVVSSTMTVNGFAMTCVSVTGNAQNNQGSVKLCTTSQGILGYASSSGSNAHFEIKSFNLSPAASLFQVPAGATMTTLPSTSTSAPSGT